MPLGDCHLHGFTPEDVKFNISRQLITVQSTCTEPTIVVSSQLQNQTVLPRNRPAGRQGFGVREEEEEKRITRQIGRQFGNVQSLPFDVYCFYFLFHVFDIWKDIFAILASESQI